MNPVASQDPRIWLLGQFVIGRKSYDKVNGCEYYDSSLRWLIRLAYCEGRNGYLVMRLVSSED